MSAASITIAGKPAAPDHGTSKVPTSPKAVAAFMAGKALVAQMIEEAVGLEGQDVGDLLAMYRGRGVEQQVFVRPHIEAIISDASLRDGFMAALSGFIVSTAGPGHAEEISNASIADCFGGSDTVYVGEEDGDASLLERHEGTAPAELAFMKGKALSAETLKALDEGRHEAEFEACARGRNKPQFTAPLDEAIDAIIADPSLRTGFSAGLCGYLSCVLDGGIPIDINYLHRYTYEDWAGGPNTVYDNEVDGASPPEASASDEEPTPTPTFTDPTEQRLDELLTRLDVCLEGLEHVDIGYAYDLLHKLVTPHFWNAREALNAHKPVDQVVSKLLLLYAALLVLEPQMGEYNPGVPLVRACSELIRKYIEGDDPEGGGDGSRAPLPGSDGRDRPSSGDEGDDFPDADRIDVAHSGATFISRLVDHFQTHPHPGTMGDLAAIHQGASVIMSALTDRVEGVESLRDRLEGALESASVILKDQPPAYWKNPGILRQRDVGKRVVESSDAR